MDDNVVIPFIIVIIALINNVQSVMFSLWDFELPVLKMIDKAKTLVV